MSEREQRPPQRSADALRPASYAEGASSDARNAAGMAAVRRIAEEPKNNLAYHAFAGQAFIKQAGDAHAVSPDDVYQGAINDCWLIAAMRALARTNPSLIEQLVRTNPDGTYDVTLFVPKSPGSPEKQAHVVRNLTPNFPTTVPEFVPKYFRRSPAYASGGGGVWMELWGSLIEKAVAVWKQGYPNLGASSDLGEGLSLLTLGITKEFHSSDHSDDELLSILAQAVEQGRPVVLGVGPSFPVHVAVEVLKLPRTWFEAYTESDRLHLVDHHAYALVRVDRANRTLDIQNPKYDGIRTGLSIKDFRKIIQKFAVGPLR